MRFLDTSFLVDLLRGAPAAVRKAKLLQESTDLLGTPSPCVAELLRGLRHASARNRAEAEALLDQLEIAPLDERAARRAGEAAAETSGRGREVAMVDCLVAGVVLSAEGSLVSRDVDFARIPGLSIETY